MIQNPHMLPKVRSDALRQSCDGFPCSLRLAGLLGLPCAPMSTVVGCHLPVIGKGVGTKVSDIFIAAGCKTCHDILDGVGEYRAIIEDRYPAAFAHRILMGLAETQSRWIGMGLIVVPDGRMI